MPTKANLVDYIIENFEGPNGMEVSRTKLEAFKKADLEEFIQEKDSMDNVQAWLDSSAN